MTTPAPYLSPGAGTSGGVAADLARFSPDITGKEPMMTQINDGGAAFPIPHDDRPGAYPAEPGMSLRDWFAGQALVGLVHDVSVRQAGQIAYQYADAMLAARTTPEASA